jgi:SAM-dependent methyltransferase
MKTEWDYTNLAIAYLKRPDYAPAAIDAIVAISGAAPGSAVCDVGAGVAHLTLPLLQRGLKVSAVEPNDAMRALGVERTKEWATASWREGTGEATGEPTSAFKLVTFGSSFNVTDRPRALRETIRLLRPRGWFACLWNHRDLDSPLQGKIESVIRAEIPDFDYGSRRENQTPIIEASGLFESPIQLEATVRHRVPVAEILEAWRSHATLQRQAGDRLGAIIDAIDRVLRSVAGGIAEVPYTTRVWVARAKAAA